MKLKINKYSPYFIDTSVSSCVRNFPRDRSIYMDIGCGDGEFIVELAKNNPRKICIGVEIKYGRIMKCLRKAEMYQLNNLKFILSDATLLIDQIIPPKSLNKIFVNNPDPWPKEKHEKNRILNSEFLKSLYKSLKRKGLLYITTDSIKYRNSIEKEVSILNFKKNNKLSNFDTKLPATRFQKFYINQNKKIYNIKLQKL